MKKLLSLVIVLTLLLTMGIGVFAETTVYDDWEEVEIEKELDALGVNPEETFEFIIGAGVVLEGPATSAPAFSPNTFSITLAQGIVSGLETIDLPAFNQIGVYEYPVTETAGDTAGMIYDGGTYYLKVTVINDGEGGLNRVLTIRNEDDLKVDSFENEFLSGDLIITKEITGNFAEYDEEFEVTVILTPPTDKVIKEGPIAVSGASSGLGTVSAPDADGKVTVTFMVTNGSSVKIANIPYGVSYAVSEDSGDYTETITPATGTMGEGEHLVEIENNLDREIEVGVNLDNLPYILILATVSIGLFGFTMKRRFSNK